MIQSETGTGKTALVKYIYQKLNCVGPMVDVNCGGIPESLAEAEFFGYQKGAFTDAGEDKIGKMELADKGVLFLDEIGNMPIVIQQKILKVIEEKKITRIGSNSEKNVHFLLITATNENLEKAVQEKRLKKDLYYRISKPTLQIPTLNEYPEVIPQFVRYFVVKFNKEYQNKIPDGKGISGIYKKCCALWLRVIRMTR